MVGAGRSRPALVTTYYEPDASAHNRAEAYNALQVARYANPSSRSRPTYAEWMRAPALHDFFWLCPRCRIVNSNDEVACSSCFDTRSAILGTTQTAELAALDKNTQRISYGRHVVRCSQCRRLNIHQGEVVVHLQ